MKKIICILLLFITIISLTSCDSAEPTIQYIEKEVLVQQCCGNKGVEYAPIDGINVAIICKACGRGLGELPMAIIEKEIVVEKEVIKEIPVEIIIEKEVIKEVPTEVIIEKEIIVEKEIIKEIEKPVEVIIEKEVEIIVEKIIEKQIPLNLTYCNDYADYKSFVPGTEVVNLLVMSSGYVPTSSGNYWSKADVIVSNGNSYATKNYYTSYGSRLLVQIKGGFSVSYCAVSGTIISREIDAYGRTILTIDATTSISCYDLLFINNNE